MDISCGVMASAEDKARYFNSLPQEELSAIRKRIENLPYAPSEESYFSKKLKSDPELARRCEEIVETLRALAKEETEACERSDCEPKL